MAETDESPDSPSTTDDEQEEKQGGDEQGQAGEHGDADGEPVDPAVTINKNTVKIAGGATLAVVIVVLLSSVIWSDLTDPETNTGAFATVNGENITYDDLADRRGMLAALGRQPQPDQTLQELLIDEALLIDAAEQRGLLPARDNISSSIDDLITTNDVNRSRYEQRLRQQGLTWSHLLTYYQERQGISAVIDELGQNNTVSEEELRRTYEENEESFELPRRMQVRHILLTKNAANDSVNALAKRIIEQARNGTDFCDLVQEHSDDPGSRDNCGRYNVSRDSQFVQPFIDAAFNMSEGEYRLVNSSFGYHVMVKDGELPAETQSFSEVRDQIRSQYERQQEVNILTRIIEDLRRNATITVYEDSLENKTTARDVVPDNESQAAQDDETTPNTTDDQAQAGDGVDEEETTPPTDQDNTNTQPQGSDGFASCLADANATLYVVDWSPHSDDQLDEIGGAADQVDIVDCDQDSEACDQANVSTYPTWTFNDETRVEGYRSQTSLSQTLSCN